jgi:hypothetical protein
VLRDIFQVLCQFMPEEGGPELQPSRRPRAAGGGFSPRAGVPGPEPQRPHRPAATLAGGAGQATVPAAAGQGTAVVGSLRRLQVLGLSGCNLTGPIPFFTALGSLRALLLDRNWLDLCQFNLSENRLTGGDRAAGGVHGAARQAARRAGQPAALHQQWPAADRVPRHAAVR